METKTEKLARNLVESGQWLSFEVYVAWIREQDEPELAEDCETSECESDAPTVRPPLAA